MHYHLLPLIVLAGGLLLAATPTPSLDLSVEQQQRLAAGDVAVLDTLPPGTQQVGFYSYGEISPHASGRCDLHNQTMTLTVLGEVT